MKQAQPSPDTAPDRPPPSALAGLLSYLVPGLGQIYQGRVAKGVLFLVCLYALFFYGLYLGNWQNVYIQFTPAQERFNQPPGAKNPFTVISDRARFFAQAWIGVAAWPAVLQYLSYDTELAPDPPRETKPKEHPFLKRFEQMPTEFDQNDMLRASDKGPDLGWVYTVIAGVLNILVIYDAYAGPVFPARRPTTPPPQPTKEVPA